MVGCGIRAVEAIPAVQQLRAFCSFYQHPCLRWRQVPQRLSVTKISFLAIFAAINVFLNPVVINYVEWHLHSRFAVGVGGEGLRSFADGFISFIAGIVALIRILRSRRSLRGLPFAIVGIIGGVIWAVFWAQLYIRFAWGMAHW